jgi:hypothetical protein
MLGYMKAMVIGGTGTVGSQVTAELQKRNVTVAVMSRSAEKFANLPPGVQGVVGDLQQPQTLPALSSWPPRSRRMKSTRDSKPWRQSRTPGCGASST